MKNLHIIPMFGLVLAVASGCENCEQHQVADLKFTWDDLRINPYDGHESLTFTTKGGDSVVFPKGERKTEQSTNYQIDYETAKNYHNGCQGDYYISDFNWMVKHTTESNSRLDINLGFRYSFKDPADDKAFNLYFWIKAPQLLCFSGEYNFKEDTLLNYKGFSYASAKDSIVTFHPVWTPGSKVFQDVYELYCHNPDTRDSAWISTAFYSVEKGLVGFRTTYGKEWVLDD
jgi:hypothetical protein